MIGRDGGGGGYIVSFVLGIVLSFTLTFYEACVFVFVTF